MTTDYDASRKPEEEPTSEPIEELKVGTLQQVSAVDEDDAVVAEGFELPGADLSNEELSVRVLPKQEDEFTCMKCFLLRHHSQLASDADGEFICTDCAA